VFDGRTGRTGQDGFAAQGKKKAWPPPSFAGPPRRPGERRGSRRFILFFHRGSRSQLFHPLARTSFKRAISSRSFRAPARGLIPPGDAGAGLQIGPEFPPGNAGRGEHPARRPDILRFELRQSFVLGQATLHQGFAAW
jgi:hypothetical protein